MKLLLVNKNPIVRKLVKLSAERSGVQFFEIESLEELESYDFNLLLIDDESLEDNVLEPLKEKIPNAKYGLIHSRNREQEVGFELFIQKPFLPTDMVDILKNELQNSAPELEDSNQAPQKEAMENPDVLQEAHFADSTEKQGESPLGEKIDEELGFDEDSLDIGEDWAVSLEEHDSPAPEPLAPEQEEMLNAIDLGMDSLDLELPTTEEKEAFDELNEAVAQKDDMQENMDFELDEPVNEPQNEALEPLAEIDELNAIQENLPSENPPSEAPTDVSLQEDFSLDDLSDDPSFSLESPLEGEDEALSTSLNTEDEDIEALGDILEEQDIPSVESSEDSPSDDESSDESEDKTDDLSLENALELGDMMQADEQAQADEGEGQNDEELIDMGDEMPDMPMQEEGGVLDADELQEVKNLLEENSNTMSMSEDSQMDDIKIESNELASLTEEALSEALGEELPARLEDDFGFDDDLAKEVEDMNDDFKDLQEDMERGDEQIPAPMNDSASVPANDTLKDIQNLPIPALKELLNGMQLTVSISFPDKK